MEDPGTLPYPCRLSVDPTRRIWELSRALEAGLSSPGTRAAGPLAFLGVFGQNRAENMVVEPPWTARVFLRPLDLRTSLDRSSISQTARLENLPGPLEYSQSARLKPCWTAPAFSDRSIPGIS